MYNGHEYLSCIKINASKQTTTRNTHRSEKAETMDLVAEHRDLILVANKVFGEGKWNHTVVSQTLDFVEIIGAKCCTGCVSFVKVQLENGNFHEDIGYYSAEESTKGLSIHNARIGSAVNALRRVLLSFGDKIEKELQQLQKQIKQANGIQKSVIQSDEQIDAEKSNFSIKTLPYQELNKDTNYLTTEIREIFTMNSTTKANPSSSTIDLQTEFSKEMNLSEEKPEISQALSVREMQRRERKRKQMEKQMEFKRRMMEKEGSIDNKKPNPKY